MTQPIRVASLPRSQDSRRRSAPLPRKERAAWDGRVSSSLPDNMTTTRPSLPPLSESNLRRLRRQSRVSSRRLQNALSDQTATAHVAAHDQGVHQHFQETFFRHRPTVSVEEPFEEVFDLPPSPSGQFMADPRSGSRDLEECCTLFRLQHRVDLTPMERFELATPTHDHSFVDSQHLLQHVLNRSCSWPEVADAHPPKESYVADTCLHSRLESLDSPQTIRQGDRNDAARNHDESWLDSDSNSDGSNVSLSTGRSSQAVTQHPNTEEIVRTLLSTSGTAD